MIKKGLFKKVTALTLALCLAASPTFVYAADEVVEVFAEEEEKVSDDVGYSSSDDAEEVFQEEKEVNEEINEEETVYDEPEFVAEDIIEENNEPVFVEDSFVEEQSVTEDVAAAEEAFGVSDEIMEQLVAGAENDVAGDVITEETVTDDSSLATNYKITFNGGTGSGGSMDQQTVESGVSTPLDLNKYTGPAGSEGFLGWSTSATGTTVTYRDGASIRVTADTPLYAVWGAPVASVSGSGVKYGYLKDAFNAVAWNGTVTLEAESTSTEAITVDRTCTLVTGDTGTSKKVAGQITVAAGNQLTISGNDGVFTYAPKESSSDALKLQGGIYPSNVIDLCDTGYYVTTVTESNTTKYKVINSAVARIGSIYYATIADALAGVNASSGTVTLYLINDIDNTNDAGKLDNTVVKNNLVIETGKENNGVVSAYLRNLSGDTARIRFDGTLTISDKVTLDNVLIGSVNGTTLKGKLDTAAASGFYSLGGTLEIDSAASMNLASLNVLYGSTVNVTGALEAEAAISSTPTTGSPLSLTTDLVIGNRGSNTVNIKNAVSVVTGNLSGSNDGENGGTISGDLVNYFNYKPSSIPANTVSTINLDNAVLKAASINFGTAGVGKKVDLKNKSQLIATGALTLSKNDSISMGWDSKITAGTWTNSGTLEIDLNGLTATKFDAAAPSGKIVVVAATTNNSRITNVTLKNNSGYSVALDGQNIAITKAVVTVTHGSTTTGYASVEEALAAALDGDTITLQQNATLAESFTVTGKKKLTLDTNGYVLTAGADERIFVDAGSELTIKDAYSGGIANASNNSTIEVSGTLNVQSGEIGGQLTISLQNKNAKVSVSGGTITKIAATKGTVEVSNGTIDYVEVGDLNPTTELAKATFTGGTIENQIGVSRYYDTVSVTSTLTTIIDSVTPPTDTAYVWVTSGGMSNLVTLENALNKSAAGSVVKLSEDVTTSAAIDVTQEVTLDLNGHWIKGTGSTYVLGVKNGAKLTVINSTGTEKSAGEFVGVTSTTCETAICMNPDNNRNPSTTAELIVGSASDTGSNVLLIKGASYGISGTAKNTNTAVTVNGGTVTGDTTAIFTPQEKSTVTINGGKIYAPTNAIYISSGSTLKIKGGTVGNATTGTSVYTKQVSGGSAINVDITGGTINARNYSIYEENGNSVNNVTICVAGGNIGDDIHADNARGFLEGGRYQSDPTKNSHKDYVVAGATVTELTGTYKYQLKSDVKRYTVTTTYTSGGSATAPTVTPSGAQKASTSITVTAGAASTGYKFDGWYENDKQVSTSSSYKFNITANRTLEARYLKALTITAPTENVTLGQDYKGTASLIKVTGLNSSDSESTMIDKSAAVIAAASYKKDTAKVGDTFDTSVTGVKLTTAGAKKYYIASYDIGKLTVIKSATAEEFVKAVEKLPTADKATVENRTAVDAAKTMYEGLSTAEKNQADVKSAKTKLDAVDTAVTNHEKADAADALIKALPDAKDATSADREALDAANEAYKALTDEQKKMVPDADREKLAQVEAAVKAAEKADQEAAAAVKNLIDALPSVTEATAADRDALTEAQEAYDALTPEQKKLLPGAEATLEALDEVITAAEKDQKAADAVTKMINALPDPEDATAADRGVVDEAKAALDKLTPAQQKLVPQTAKDRLEAVDEAVKSKEGGDDQKAADACMEKIEAIKKQPAGKGKAATEEARAAYDALTDAQKALLPKSAESQLVAAEEAYTKDRTFECGDAMYKVLPSGNVSYNRPSDTKCTSAVVPNQIKKNGYMYKVVKVSIGAFKNCENLNWVVINKNIAAIGKYAFKNTPSLTKINIKSRTLKTGKVVSAFAAGGKSNGAKLLVKTPSAYVNSYTSLFKGEGLLNQKAKVQAA